MLTSTGTSEPTRREMLLVILLATMMALTIWAHVRPARCVWVEIPQIEQGEPND